MVLPISVALVPVQNLILQFFQLQPSIVLKLTRRQDKPVKEGNILFYRNFFLKSVFS